MPKPRKYQLIQCTYFTWKLYPRSGVWYADGRSQATNLGRHSLGVQHIADARRLLSLLDRKKAEELGLAPASRPSAVEAAPLALLEGRRMYEAHIGRPAVTGGLRNATRKKYRSHLDKLIDWLRSKHVAAWNDLSADLLQQYAQYLKAGGPPAAKKESYSDKSILNELTFAKQLVKWFIQAGHLPGQEPIQLKVRKAESERPYCWRPQEVTAMVEYCRAEPSLNWLGDVIVALACTGLRISELVELRWSDIDLTTEMLRLTDETNRSSAAGQQRELKSRRSRSFPIHQQLLAVLAAIPRQGRYIFYGPRRGRLKPDTVRRILVREVLTPLAEKFPALPGEQSFAEGRLHSFRHYFCSMCANNGTPEQMLMTWLGHHDSEMVRHYYHLHDGEARRRMNGIDFLGLASGEKAAQRPNRKRKSGRSNRSA